MTRPVRRFLSVISLLVVCCAVSAVTAAFILRPEVASEPVQDAVPLSVPVIESVVSRTQILGATVVDDVQRVPIPVEGVVTAVPDAREGIAAILEVQGRPVLPLDMAFALYRDLQPGDSGTDVSQLQAGLASAGLFGGARDGKYGTGTQTAVRKLYEAAGYDPPADVGGQAVLAAEQAVTAAGSDPAADPRVLDDARAALRAARAAVGTPVLMTEVIASRASAGFRLDRGALQVGDRLPLPDAGLSLVRAARRLEVPKDDGTPAGTLAAGAAVILGTDHADVVARVQEVDGATRVELTQGLPEQITGQTTLRIVFETSGSPVLAVPPSAITEAEGSTTVTLIGPPQEIVPVTVGVVGDDLVQVSAPGLRAGDLVQIAGP